LYTDLCDQRPRGTFGTTAAVKSSSFLHNLGVPIPKPGFGFTVEACNNGVLPGDRAN
jgi:hypothetical protein